MIKISRDTDLAFKIALEALEVVVSVDVGVEACPGSGCIGAEVALVHDAILVRGEAELELLLILQVAIHSIAVGHNTCSLGFWFPIVKNAVVKNLEFNLLRYFILFSVLPLST